MYVSKCISILTVFIIGAFILFFSGNICAFEKTNSAGNAIYEYFVLGRSSPNLVVWKVSDTVWLANYGGYKLPVWAYKEGPQIYIQIYFRSDTNCTELKQILGPSLEVFADSIITYKLPVSMIVGLDSSNCLHKFYPRSKSTSVLDDHDGGYDLFYGEIREKGVVNFYLRTHESFRYSGMKLNVDPLINETRDTVIVHPQPQGYESDILLPAFGNAGGGFTLDTLMTGYRLLITLGYDTAVFSVRITHDSLIVQPENLSLIDLCTIPHRRVPSGVFYVLFIDVAESRQAEIRDALSAEFKKMGAIPFFPEPGNYGSFHVEKDRLNYFIGENPAIFFKYSDNLNIIEDSWPEIYKKEIFWRSRLGLHAD